MSKKSEHAVSLNVRVPSRMIDDIEVIAQYLVDQGDIKALWGDGYNKSYVVDYAIRRLAKHIRKQQTDKQ